MKRTAIARRLRRDGSPARGPMSTITLCWLVAYVAGAVGCAIAIAADFYRHRDGLPLASVVWRVVVSAVLWPLVALFAVVDIVARGRR